MNRFGRNTISNIATKLWSIVSIYLFVPFYIKILGETSYGLVSFFATLQNTMQFLGLGLANTLRSEFAVAEDGYNCKVKKYLIFRGIENIYFVICFIIILFCSAGSKVISTKWLNIENLDNNSVSIVISLMGMSIAIQMIANLYSGCLFGLDYQTLANECTIIWSVAKSVGALLIIKFIKPDLILFYAWHIVTDVLYMIVLRVLSVKKLHLKSKITWHLCDFKELRNIWKYTLGILLISLIALVNRQLDKIIISKKLSITELGAYNVATTLGGATAIISSAVYTSIFPRFTKSATSGDLESLKKDFVSINKLVNIIVSCMSAYIAAFSIPLIEVWTGSHTYSSMLATVSFLVVIAVSFVEYQEIPYALVLANGNTKINVFVGLLFLPIVSVFTFLGIRDYGLLGAGVVYMLMMIMQTILYEFLVYKKYVTDHPVELIFCQTVVPFLVAIVVAFISKEFIYLFNVSTLLICVFAVILGLITLVVFIYFTCKAEIIEFLKIRKDCEKSDYTD